MDEITRDKDGTSHIVGLSFGKDSVCMAIALQEREPRPYTFVCTPTGDELPEMIDHMVKVEKLIGHKVRRLTNGTLANQIIANKMLPSHHARWCTRLLKLKPFGKFLEFSQPCVAYVGIRDDEDEREGTRPGGDSASIHADVRQDFPFQRWGWGVEQVWSYLAEKGVSIPERTDCARCPYQKLGEWYNLWLNHRDIFDDAKSDEIKMGHTFRSPSRDTWPASLSELDVLFSAGRIPDRSLRMMEKRKGMCRACSM